MTAAAVKHSQEEVTHEKIVTKSSVNVIQVQSSETDAQEQCESEALVSKSVEATEESSTLEPQGSRTLPTESDSMQDQLTGTEVMSEEQISKNLDKEHEVKNLP